MKIGSSLVLICTNFVLAFWLFHWCLILQLIKNHGLFRTSIHDLSCLSIVFVESWTFSTLCSIFLCWFCITRPNHPSCLWKNKKRPNHPSSIIYDSNIIYLVSNSCNTRSSRMLVSWPPRSSLKHNLSKFPFSMLYIICTPQDFWGLLFNLTTPFSVPWRITCSLNRCRMHGLVFLNCSINFLFIMMYTCHLCCLVLSYISPCPCASPSQKGGKIILNLSQANF